MKMPNVAVIGISGFGKIYFDNFVRLAREKRCRFAAAVVRTPAKVPAELSVLQELGCKVFPTEEAMYQALPGELDLVGIPTAIASHREMTERALACGANVLVEKPLAGSFRDAEAIVAAVKSHPNQFAAVGFQHVYAKDFHHFKEVISSGKLGALREIRTIGLWPRGDRYYFRNSWAGRRTDGAGRAVYDSPLNNAFAHYLNLAFFLAGEAELVEAELRRARSGIENFDTCYTHFRTPSGVDIKCAFSHACSDNHHPEVAAILSRGMIHWDLKEWRISDEKGSCIEADADDPPTPAMFDAVLRRLDDPAAFIDTPEDALAHVRCIDALQNLPILPLECMVNKEGVCVVPGIEEKFSRFLATGEPPQL